MARRNNNRIIASSNSRLPMGSGRQVVLVSKSNGANAERLLRMTATRVNGRRDPPPTTSDIVITKIQEYNPTISRDTNVVVTPTLIAANIPNCFDKFRLVKVSVWANAIAGNVSIQFDTDGAQFVDHGTEGAVRPQLHIMPSFHDRQLWRNPTDTESIFTISTSEATASDLVLQLTLEMRTTGKVA